MSRRGLRLFIGLPLVTGMLVTFWLASVCAAAVHAASPVAAAAPGSAPASHTRALELVDAALQRPDTSGRPNTQALEEAEAELLRTLAGPSLSARSEAQARFNLGTCLLLRDDLPRAVLEFRRAAAVCPLWEQSLLDRIRTNLNVARERAGTLGARTALNDPPTKPSTMDSKSSVKAEAASGAPTGSSEPSRDGPPAVVIAPIDPLRSWIDDALELVPASVRLVVAVLVAWAAVVPLARRWRGHLPLLSPAVMGLGLTSVALWASAWWELRRAALVPVQAVVLASGVQPRSGPDELLHSPIGSPLPVGMELLILEGKLAPGGNGWIRVQPLTFAQAADSPRSFSNPPLQQPVWVPAGTVAAIR